MKQFIGIEAGGTKFVCGYGSGPQDVHERTVIKTTTPVETLQEVVNYIRAVQQKTKIAAIGVACFGPLDLDRLSPTYGHVTTTPKPGWGYFNIVGALKQNFKLPIGFDTDVNAAALGEFRWGAGQQLRNFIYLTVGTGIGGGVMSEGNLVHGAMHPEMGHIIIGRLTDIDKFTGTCQYHGYSCLESLASGPAMKERWQVKSALDLPPEHPAWDLEAHYLGMALASFTCILSPQRIILGGGVMRQTQLFPKIRKKLLESLNGYIKNPTVIEGINEYVVPPGLQENSGICGAFALAETELLSEEKK